MNAELEAIRDKWVAKNENKARVMEALGRAKLADVRGEPSENEWQIVMDFGVNGDEGRLHREVVDMCDDYVEAHSGEFGLFRDKEEDDVVKMLEAFRQLALDEDAWRAQAWLFHKYEPKNVGGPMKSVVRIRGG